MILHSSVSRVLLRQKRQQGFSHKPRILQIGNMPRLRHQYPGAANQLSHFTGFTRWSRFVLIAAHHQCGRCVQFAQSWQQIIAPKRNPPHRHDAFTQAIRG